MDCLFNHGNFGCNGGNLESVMAYATKNPIAMATDYPWTGISHAPCKQPATGLYIKSYVSILPKQDPDVLLSYVQ